MSDARHPAPPDGGASAAEEPPPLGSWTRLYAIVVLELVLLIAGCALIARWGR